jgi:uncharacterized integral membrane protein
MMRVLKWLLLAPLIVLAVLFALANRESVTVSFDPFATDIVGFAIRAPLFVVLILAVMLGVVLGSVVTWFSQGRYRKAARQERAQAIRMRDEADRLRQDAGTRLAQLPAPRA